jgi:hypothetical protein
MLWTYVAGNVLGRLLASYLIVWLVCLGLCKGDWRAAFRRSRGWVAILSVLILFVLGLAMTFSRGATA